jgi:hypothetical protein
MNDFPDLTPPPGRPLGPEQRARLRAGLPSSDSSSRRPWVLTAVSAAAVVVLGIGGTVALTHSVGDERPPHTAQPAGQPAGGATVAVTPAPPAVSASADPCAKLRAAERSITGALAEVRTRITGVPAGCFPSAPPTTCAAEVRDQLRGATEIANDADGAVGFWRSGRRWVLCYHDARVTTVQHVHDLGAALDDGQRFGFSTDHGDVVGGQMPTTFVAGGPLGGGDSRISYTFPDGHRQEATYVDAADGSRWWVMVYVARRGVLADPDTNWGQLDPVVVRLYGTDVSPPDRISLDWGASGCNQVNHGC